MMYIVLNNLWFAPHVNKVRTFIKILINWLNICWLVIENNYLYTILINSNKLNRTFFRYIK